MDILNPRSLRQRAVTALRRGREPKKLIYAYAGLTLAMSLGIFLANLWLDAQISGTGGLGNMGDRAILATIQQVIPLFSGFIAMCLDLGFLSGLMRISRGQYADHTDLKTGFRKFWSLVRLALLQSLLYFAIAFLALQLGSMIFMFTPRAEPLMEMLYPIYESGNFAISDAQAMELFGLMIPMLIIIALVFLAVLLPFLFRMRMAFFCLLDDPRGGAMAAIRTSSRMMRGRFLQLLKIDLNHWLYYAGTMLGLVVLWGDVILALLGVNIPLDAQVLALVACVGSAAVQFAVCVYLRPTAEITYLTAYDALREKPQDDGVVLGNIFDM